MKKNVGNLDSYFRFGVAGALSLAVLGHYLEGFWMLFALVVAFVMAVTGYVRFCPIYSLFGANSCENKASKKD